MMGETTVMILLGISVVSVIVCVWKAFVWLWWKPMKLEKCLREQGIRGPPFRLLHGNMKESASYKEEAKSKPMELSHSIVPRVVPFLHQVIQKYGPLSYTWFGVTPRVNIMDPELIKIILLAKAREFHNIEPSPLQKFVMKGLVGIEGEQWAKHRKILNPAFHIEKLKMMVPAMHASCVELINKWEKLALNGSCELDVWHELRQLSGDVIARTAFGSSYKEGRRIFELQIEQAELVSLANQSIYLPGYRFLPTKRNKRMNEIEREEKALLAGIINKRESAVKDGEAHNNDLLGLLLDSNFKQIQQEGNPNCSMTMDEIIEECLLFYLAGEETTAVLLSWTMALLSMHQEWQARAREEVMQIFGKSKPKYEEVNQLRIVTMILYEVLRLYPPVETITKYNYKETEVGSITLPPGVQIGIPTVIIHHDHELWGKDAEEFNPERFSEGISKATNNQLSFIPFGSGPRICIGYNFALIEAKLAIASILQHFSFELSPTYIHAPNIVLIMEPQHGIHVILHKL